MCGICGFFGEGALKDLKAMNDRMAYRGPDEEGIWKDEKERAFLGHRRLSIIDLAGGQQPMWTADGTLGIVFNGEIYNHLDIRRELKEKGYTFRTDHSDTETLLYAYKEWGSSAVSRLNGMWAFAIYDRRNGNVFFSRDRFGKKPLFYTLQNRTLVFSSELSSLIKHPSVTASISKRSLKKYFAYGYIPAPSTLYENIYKLPGGFNMEFDLKDRSLKRSRYWDFVLEPFDKIPKNPEKVWGEQLISLLDAAVKRRLMSDVPLGVFLSGGIDSSLVTALASRYFPEKKLKTFSIGFDEKSFDESQYFNLVSGIFRTDHYTENFSLDTAKGLVPEIASMLDEPMGDSSILPTYLLSRATRKQVKVAVGGDGADELFAGYDPFKAIRAADVYNRLVPMQLHRAITLVASALPTTHKNMSLDFKLKRTIAGLKLPQNIRQAVWMGPLNPGELEDVFGEPCNLEEVYSEAIEYWDRCENADPVDKTLTFFTKLYLQDDILVKVDRASMFNSLEVRAPFLDVEVVDFVRRIPWSFKYRGNTTKYLLKKAAEGILPQEILYRKKKGFGVPVGKWFKEGGFLDNAGGTIDMLKNADEYLAAHKKGRADNRLFLYNYGLLLSMIGSRG